MVLFILGHEPSTNSSIEFYSHNIFICVVIAFMFGPFGFSMGGHDPFAPHDHDEEEDDDDQGQEEVDNQGLYELLGVEPSASIEDIKKAYRKKARELHPDKGGDPEEVVLIIEFQFRKVSQANEILTNEEKKKLYDKYGLKGLEKGFNGGGNPLAEFFGFGGGGQEKKEFKKMKPRVLDLRVSLEDIYLGKMVTQTVSVKKICDGCQGEGGKGSKVNITMLQLGM